MDPSWACTLKLTFTPRVHHGELASFSDFATENRQAPPTQKGNLRKFQQTFPQTLNHLFMKEILFIFAFWDMWGMFQGSVGIFLEERIVSLSQHFLRGVICWFFVEVRCFCRPRCSTAGIWLWRKVSNLTSTKRKLKMDSLSRERGPINQRKFQ